MTSQRKGLALEREPTAEKLDAQIILPISFSERVSNQEFTDGIFHRRDARELVWVTSFQGDPKMASGADWRGAPGDGFTLPTIDETGNTYFNSSSVKRHDGSLGRAEENFAALYVVVLDDIGTPKTVALPKGLHPSYLLETSPGNFQAGLILDHPCTDLDQIKALSKALRAGGFSDNGAGGPQSRYARLPKGINWKPTCGPNGFHHRLKKWTPERRFTIQQIISLFELRLGADPTLPMRKASTSAGKAMDERHDAVIIGKLTRSSKTLRVWNGDDDGMGGPAQAPAICRCRCR